MKWFAFILFLIQAESVLSCVFDKVDEISGEWYGEAGSGDINDCFSACYNKTDCIAFELGEDGICEMFRSGSDRHQCKVPCYILLRDEVDPVCKTYVNV
ncbi:unnamed protein product [Cylicocyclus nassatus]|uniref:PAN-3 domain-containing protein n=1 Tax=Cylicocyclus nassatus TaxID=53992 RepID=A0AA36GN76_CYLNA|nr:unnamed protein product [Cylicocyclus nassatus]